jgi:GT2 family glycosyltransferase
VPHVSVVIPAWNAAGFIARAVDSVRAQSFADFEIVVVDDGSPDSRDLQHVLARYASDPRVRCLRQENGGPSAARNAGISAARTDRIAFLDADDWWEPAYLTRQLDLLDRGFDLVYCDARIVGDSLLAGRTYMEVTPSTLPVTFEKLVTLSCNIPTTCAMARREAMVRAGGFDPRFRRCEDFDLWMRMSAAGARIAFSREVLAAHRMHEASASADGAKMFESQIEVYEKIAALLGPSHPSTSVVVRQRQRAAADLALERSKQHLRARRYREAAGALDSARQVYRSPKLTAAAIGLRTAPGLLRLVDALRHRRRGAVPG